MLAHADLDLTRFRVRHKLTSTRDPEMMSSIVSRLFVAQQMEPAEGESRFEAALSTMRLGGLRLSLFETRHRLVTTCLEDAEACSMTTTLRGLARSSMTGAYER